VEGDTFSREICSSHEAAEWQAAMEALILVATVRRTNDVRAHRHHAGVEPKR